MVAMMDSVVDVDLVIELVTAIESVIEMVIDCVHGGLGLVFQGTFCVARSNQSGRIFEGCSNLLHFCSIV
jgi:hypothetical protein